MARPHGPAVLSQNGQAPRSRIRKPKWPCHNGHAPPSRKLDRPAVLSQNESQSTQRNTHTHTHTVPEARVGPPSHCGLSRLGMKLQAYPIPQLPSSRAPRPSVPSISQPLNPPAPQTPSPSISQPLSPQPLNPPTPQSPSTSIPQPSSVLCDSYTSHIKKKP